MKKSAVIIGGIVLAAATGAGFILTNGSNTSNIKAYYDGKSPINEVLADGETSLIKAVRANDIAAVHALLTMGASPNLFNKNGESPLNVAVKNGNYEIFAIFADLASLDLKNADLMNDAIRGGNVSIVKDLLLKGSDANAILEFKGRHRPDENPGYRDPRVITPLKKAVIENKPDIAKMLIENGAEGAQYFLTENLTTATPQMIDALALKLGSLRNIANKGTDLLNSAVNEAPVETLEYLLNKNAGDANSAFSRLLTRREKEKNYAGAVELFLSYGAVPTAENLEFSLNHNDKETFGKLARCFVNPNVMLEKQKKTLLSYSVLKGYEDAVAYLLDKNADIWATEQDGRSPIQIAVDKADENPELFKLFRARIKDINEAGYQGETLLMMFAKKGDYKNFLDILNAGGDIWQKDNNGKTVLMYASEGGNEELVKFILEKGENPDHTDKEGKRALMYAAAKGKDKVFHLLVNKGANIAATDNAGKNALMYAAENGHIQIADWLINAGESSFGHDNNNKTVLMYAAEGGNLQMVNTLLSKGANANAQDKRNICVLSYGVMGNNFEVVQALLKKGAEDSIGDKDGYFPLTYALSNGNEKIISLLDRSWNFVGNYTRDTGRTLLMYVFDSGNQDLLSSMMYRKRELINMKDNQGQTFMMLLAKDGRPDLVREALDSHGNPASRDNNGKSVLMYAAESQSGVNLVTVIKGRASGTFINLRDNKKRNALMYAVGGEYNLAVKQHLLLERGIEVNATDVDGKTPLMYALGNTFSPIMAPSVSELLQYKADVNAKDNSGKTPLMYAAENKMADAKVVEVLLNAKADINAKDNMGRSVLMYAAMSEDISKFRLLLSMGSDVNITDNEGQSLADYIKGRSICFAEAALKIIQ